MSDYKLTVELCPESGCGLIQIEKGSLRSKIDLMPDEVLEARELNGEALLNYLEDIDHAFSKGIEALGIDKIGAALREKKLPTILKIMSEREAK